MFKMMKEQTHSKTLLNMQFSESFQKELAICHSRADFEKRRLGFKLTICADNPSHLDKSHTRGNL